MKEILLKPIREKTVDYDELEKIIMDIFDEVIYKPIAEILFSESVTVQNDEPEYSAIAQAIKSGRITFYRGRFKGRLSARIVLDLRRAGAKRDRKTGEYLLPLNKMPMEIRSAISVSEEKFNQMARAIDKKLAEVQPSLVFDQLKMHEFFEHSIYKTDQAINKSLDNLVISPTLNKEQRARIATEYTENMSKYIQKFTEEHIVELRKRMEESAFRGARYESMVDEIQSSYGVSKRKAKFLARQETGLLMAKLKETRYDDAGITEYIWTCVHGSPNHPVRPDHKRLDGKRFSFKNPPVTDLKTQARNNPGEDYNCRCTAIPIVKFT